MTRQKPIAALYDRFLKKAPKQSRSRSVVEAVLGATSELLGGHDDEDVVTIQAVADRAGVGVGSLYDYFVDRGSIFSGLAAKLTEDNLVRFEAELAASRGEPLDVTVRRIMDLLFDTYLRDVRMPRIVMRIAHRAGLMPSLAASQEAFARSLAAALRERTDVKVADPEAAAYLVTNMSMGVVGQLVWTEKEPFERAKLKDEMVRAYVAYLSTPP